MREVFRFPLGFDAAAVTRAVAKFARLRRTVGEKEKGTMAGLSVVWAASLRELGDIDQACEWEKKASDME